MDSQTLELFDEECYSANEHEEFGGNTAWIGVLGFAISALVDWFCAKTTSFF